MLLLLMGVTSTFGRYLEIYAQQFAAPTTVALLRYVGVLYYFLVDILFFKQDFTFRQLLGASLMLFTNIASSFIKIKAEINTPASSEIEILNSP